MLKIDHSAFHRYMSLLESVSSSASSCMGQGAYATTGGPDKKFATWGQVLSAVSDETVLRFISRVKELQQHGIVTDTTTLFDVEENQLGHPFRPWCYIHWALDRNDADFTLLSLVGHTSYVEYQADLVRVLGNGLNTFSSQHEVIDMLTAMRAPLGAMSTQLTHYTADVICGLGVERSRSLFVRKAA